MRSNFVLFGPVHIAILLLIPGLAGLLALLVRAHLAGRRGLRMTLAFLLVANAAIWYGYLGYRGWLVFPESLPLELCDATLAATIAALLTLRPLPVDLAYYGALAGTTMALLTPDLWEPFPSFLTVQFFISHGLVVVSMLFVVWTGAARPRPGSVWRAMVAVNVFAFLVGVFNFVFGTNYMYLSGKPQNASLLDYMGPWPWYIAVGEALALLLFTALWLPYRVRAIRTRTGC